ncbi:MAG: hypothetical protein KGQ80_03215 [Bacteroidetes bacterium]|nr:hypothetical protein [Bacteroidota bacterium]
MIFSFFRTSKNRQFSYRPLYYQPEADEQSLRHGGGKTRSGRNDRSKVGGAGDASGLNSGQSDVGQNGVGQHDVGQQDVVQHQHRAALRFRRQVAQQEAQQSNRRLLFIIFIMLSLLLLLFGELKKLMYLLPVFVPLLWWTFRRAAWNRKEAERNRKEAEWNRKEADVHSTHNPPA